MKKLTLIIFIVLMLTNCNSTENQKVILQSVSNIKSDSIIKEHVTKIDTQRVNKKEESIDVEKTKSSNSSSKKINIKAFLVYQNGDLSKFNLIDNLSLNLWNTTRGEGSAGLISFQTKVIVEIPKNPDYNYIEIMVNGSNSLIYRSEVFDASLESVKTEFILDQTGCDNLKILVFQKGYTQVKKNIPFKCSE